MSYLLLMLDYSIYAKVDEYAVLGCFWSKIKNSFNEMKYI